MNEFLLKWLMKLDVLPGLKTRILSVLIALLALVNQFRPADPLVIANEKLTWAALLLAVIVTNALKYIRSKRS